ncbi:Nudix hydrolase [Balamuthia mandrillaris]
MTTTQNGGGGAVEELHHHPPQQQQQLLEADKAGAVEHRTHPPCLEENRAAPLQPPTTTPPDTHARGDHVSPTKPQPPLPQEEEEEERMDSPTIQTQQDEQPQPQGQEDEEAEDESDSSSSSNRWSAPTRKRSSRYYEEEEEERRTNSERREEEEEEKTTRSRKKRSSHLHKTVVIVAVVLEKEGQILLTQEAKSHCLGKWYLPAGRVEVGETPMEGAVRECLEETGIVMEPTGVFCIEYKATSRGHDWVRYGITGRPVGGSLKTLQQADDESLQAKWCPLEEVPYMKLRNKDVVALIHQYFNRRDQLLPIFSSLRRQQQQELLPQAPAHSHDEQHE